MNKSNIGKRNVDFRVRKVFLLSDGYFGHNSPGNIREVVQQISLPAGLG
jgi:hypothetical protein